MCNAQVLIRHSVPSAGISAVYGTNILYLCCCQLAPSKHVKRSYLEAASRIVGAGQSACCPSSPSGSASHMTHTGEEGFCYSGQGSLGGGKPAQKQTSRKISSQIHNSLQDFPISLKKKRVLQMAAKLQRGENSHTQTAVAAEAIPLVR